jgi:hypothetical protein
MRLGLFIRILLTMLAVQTAYRAGFLFWNWSTFSREDTALIALAFVHGVRFDFLVTSVLLGAVFLWPSTSITKSRNPMTTVPNKNMTRVCR